MALPDGAVVRSFRAALELEDEARESYLNEITDPAVRSQVEALLREAGALDGVSLNTPNLQFEPHANAPVRAGERLGRYRLLQLIGAGGMGQVWLAERADGLPIKVAIKWLHRAMQREGRLRFERERLVLSSLDHPGIARILDGGEDDGVPWYAMEYVAGQSLSQYVESKQPDLRTRLKLMLQICEAVVYAQQRLIVHRDLKPSNVLVREDGQAKVIDFGIAKLLGDTGEELTKSAAPMTLAYAAPEQIRGEAITTATDVYALGVMLFELLTGERPHKVKVGDAGGLSLLQAITDTDPTAPSNALARNTARAVSAQQLRGDLDTIVLKALKRDPARRYPTAQALADDLANYLNNRPIHARPDNPFYRVRKFVSRHRAASAISLIATVGIILAASAAWWSARQEAMALQRVAEMSQANAAAREFLVNLFRAAAPEQHLGKPLNALQMLERGWQQLQSSAQGGKMDALARAQTASAIGDSFYSLGAMQQAHDAYRMALQQFPADAKLSQIGKLQLDLAATEAELLNFDSARKRLSALLEWEHKPSPDLHRRVLRLLGFVERDAMNYEASVAALRQALQLQPESDIDRAGIENSLAFSLALAGHADDAKTMFDQTRQHLRSLPPQHPQRIWLDYTEGDAMRRLGDFQRAEARLDAALAQLSTMEGQGEEIRRIVQMARVVLKITQGEVPSELEWAESALRTQPTRKLNLTEIEAYWRYAEYLQRQGEVKAATARLTTLARACESAFSAAHPMCLKLRETSATP